MIFNIGDEVICINDDDINFLTIDKKYIVVNIDRNMTIDRNMICIINDINIVDMYYNYRFKHSIKTTRKLKLIKLNETK